MAGKYEAQGTGLHSWVTRKHLYTGALILGALVVATLITLGFINLDDVQNFIALTATVLGILAGIAAMFTAILAKNNVAPAEPEANLRAGTDGTHADYLN